MAKKSENKKSGAEKSRKSGSKSKSKGNGANKEYDASAEEMRAYYRDMLLLRRFEERAGKMYGLGLIGGFCHLYIGQEAVAVGIRAAIDDGDTIITSYRDHGPILACGADPKAVMAELTGRKDGVSKGKGGSMHMFDIANGFYGGHGIVGAPVPLGTGLAFAHKYRENGQICVTMFGDGAVNQGQVYESFNMAELWCLPIIYVIENNQYAMGTSVKRSSAQPDLHKRGESFSIPGRLVDGMNILEVRQVMEEAVAWVRDGKGPILLEMKTYRYRGHSMSDPAKYRSREEVKEVREKRDPIELLKRKILDKDAASEDELKEIAAEIKNLIDEVADFAEDSPEPAEDELYKDVYA